MTQRTHRSGLSGRPELSAYLPAPARGAEVSRVRARWEAARGAAPGGPPRGVVDSESPETAPTPTSVSARRGPRNPPRRETNTREQWFRVSARLSSLQ